jgi:hypothetical protein
MYSTAPRAIRALSLVGTMASLWRLHTLPLFVRVLMRGTHKLWLWGCTRPLLTLRGTLPAGSPSTAQTMLGVAALWGMDKGVARLLLRGGSRLPSSIVSLLLSTALLSGVRLLGGRMAADRVLRMFQPGVVFLGRWLLAFLTAVITPLPSAVGELWAQGGLPTLVKVLLVHMAGWVATHTSTTAVAWALGSDASASAAPMLPTGAAAAVASACGTHDAADATEPRPPRPGVAAAAAAKAALLAHRRAVRSVWTTATALSCAALPWLGSAPALVCVLQSSLLHAEQHVPKAAGPAAPMLCAALGTSLACWGLGLARGDSLAQSFAAYHLRVISIPTEIPN